MSGAANWNGDGAIDYVRGRAAGFITRAAIEVKRRAQELLSIPGTANRIKNSGKHKKGEHITAAVRSKPGEPPRKQTGQLRASVTYEYDEKTMTARVGTPLKYGGYLELGTKRGIAPRPGYVGRYSR